MLTNPNPQTDHTTTDLKIIIIGNTYSGKTSFVGKYIQDQFPDNYLATIVSDFSFKLHRFKDKLYKVQLWDLAGQDNNTLISRMFCRGAHGVIVMCDITNSKSLADTIKWKKSLEECTNFPDGSPIPIMLLRNKADLHSETEDIVQDYEADFSFRFDVSAKTGKNVHESMELLISSIIHRLEALECHSEKTPVKVTKQSNAKPEKQGKCCFS